jgi:hypothetical protein
MKKCLDMSMDAGQEHAISIQAFGQQLYAIAQQVKWPRPDILEPHILRLGGFHGLSTFIFVLGKLWADGGLHDLLVDFDVYAGNTVEQMLKGKQFNRAVRRSMACSGTACLISILISVKYLHDQEICFQAV